MIATLLRRTHLLSWLVLLLLLLGGTRPAQASHLLGGEMTYKYLNATGPTATPYRYEITLTIYTNCNSSVTAPTAASIYIYNQATGALLASPSVARTFISPTCVTVPVPPGCTNTGATQQPFKVNRYVTTVSLPAAANGYYAYFTSGNRNAGIANIATPDYEYLTLYATLARPALANNSPVFATDALAVLCAADTTVVLNNAVDIDGDRLEYSFATPYSVSTYPTTFALPLKTVTYNANYSNIRPLGTLPNSAKINASSGISKFYALNTGAQYAVAIDVKEYRTINGVETLIGTTRRDVQLIVGSCPPTMPPVLPTSTVMPRSYTIEAGSTLSIPITATQPDNHPLTLMASSTLLDGAGGYVATFGGNAGTPVYTGSPLGSYTVASTTNGTVAGTFVFTPACTDVRSTPYDVTLLVNDVGCAGKLRSDVLRITVVKPTGPTAITGNLAVCGLGTTQTYTATGGTAPQINWTVTGGTIVGSATANPVTVNWTTVGTGTITAQGVSQYGCLLDQVTQNVVVSPVTVLTITGNLTICQGGSTTLTVAGASNTYVLTGGPAPVMGTGPFVVSPTQTTTYTIRPAVVVAYGCPATGQVTVVVNPPPVANPGAAVSFCSGGSAQLGTAPVTGYTYSWSPATGLSSATVANPTVTLTNTTAAATTQTYTLTVTDAANCTSTGTVAVTVNPTLIANPGSAVSFCSGGSAQLGTAPVTGVTYSWSPATGLSSPTSANPTVTLTNTTSAPVTQTYTLTVSASGCTSTGTVAVTVNPAPAANAGAAVAFCSGSSAQLGAAPASGVTYSWSPTAGLSSTTVANPTVMLANTTGAPITQTYTLTATNATGCTSTGTVAVTVNPAPVANAGGAVVFCSGGTGQLGAAPVAGVTYSWSPSTGLSSATSANPTVTLTNTTGSPRTQTYTLTVTGSGGCSATSTVAVTVDPLPTANAGMAVAFCAGGTGQLGAAAVSGLTYNWVPATGLSSATSANPTVMLPNATSTPITQTYTLTATNAAGCSATSTVAVTVNPAPVANAGAAVAFCSGGTGQLGAAPVSGVMYSWSPATGLSSSTSANPTVTLTNTTSAPVTRTYILVTSTAAGCTSTATVTVTVNPLPVANAGAAVTLCPGGSASLGTASVAGATYSWSPTTGLSNSTVANPTVTLMNATGAPIAQTYTLTVTTNGCTSTGSVVVTVNPLPVANAGATVAFCAGSSAQLGAAPVSGVAYSWSPATGLSSATVANPTVTLPNATNAPITQTYTLTATNAAGCTSTATVAVTVSPQPLAVAGAALTRCSGNAGLLGAAPVAGHTYSWSPAAGLSSTTVADPTVTLVNTTGTAATHTYTLTVTSASGCTSTSTVAVTVLPALLPGSIGADQTVCAGSLPAPLTSLSAAGGGLGSFAYQWESSPDNLTWTALANVTTPTCTPGPVAATTYFRRRVTASCGTAYSNVVTVTAQPLLLPAVALPVLPAQCAGTAFTFTPVPTNAGNSPTYQWFVNGTAVGTGPGYTSNTLRDGDVVRVVMTPTVGFCASGPAIATTRVSLTPVLISSVKIAATTILPACPGEVVAFGIDAVANIGTSPQYQWQVDGVSVAGATGPRFSSRTLRDGQAVTLVVRSTDACGQPATATSNAVRVSINQPAALSAGPDKTITQGESVVLEGTASNGAVVVWSPAQTLTFASGDQLRPTAAPLATTTYTLSAGTGGCASTSQVTVTVLPRLRIPNAFSPNGDNNDDSWQIDNIEAYPNSRVVVFNRWGAKIFEAANYSRSSEWRGTINGQPVPFGTYYYIITLGNGKSFTGPLTVIN